MIKKRLLLALLIFSFVLIGCAIPEITKNEELSDNIPQTVDNTPKDVEKSEAGLINEAIRQDESLNRFKETEAVKENQVAQQYDVITSSDTLTGIKESDGLSKNESISKFMEWAEKNNIDVIGVNKSANDFYYNGAKAGDFLDAKGIPNILKVAEGLYKIPENLIRVMSGKAFYLSYQPGRGYTILSSWPEQNILSGMGRGSIIEQPLTREQTVHEFAHILDYHGIRGFYDDAENYWKHLESKRKDIFEVKGSYDPDLKEPLHGFIDVYSSANDAENFAQHFTAYIFQGEEFRKRAENDSSLKKKYDFFKSYLFDGREY